MVTRISFFAGLVSALGLVAAGCAGDDPKPLAVDAGLAADASVDAGERPPDAVDEGDAAVSAAPSSVGSCCEAQGTAGCEAPEVEACVCAIDRLCCAGAWDARCVELVDSEGCGQCGAAPSNVCEAHDASDAAPSTMQGALGGGASNDAIELSCGSIAEPEVLFAFTAPEAGSYSFSTGGSQIFDTVLAVIDGSTCDGEELGCNDDEEGDLSSRLVLELAADQQVLIAVESWGEEAGEVSVEVVAGEVGAEVEPAQCAPAELAATVPASAEGEASSQGNLLTPSCALFGSSGDALYLFTADQDGRYRFDTRGSVADTIVQVLDGIDCAGEELACNDDPELGGLSAIADVDLELGQTVLVNVDSLDGMGSYTLTVDRIDPSLEEMPEPSADSCCSAHAGAGCNDAEIAACVCAVDETCCNNTWDSLCADAVSILECGGC
jgi:hypothetical protein